MTAELTMTVGLPASGKTTWSRAQVAAAPVGTTVIIGRNELRWMMFGPDYSAPVPAAEDVVTAVQRRAVRAALVAGTHVIVDDCNLSQEAYRQWHELATDVGAAWYVVSFLDVPLEVCQERNAAREGSAHVPPEIIERMARHRRQVAKRLRADTAPPSKVAAP